MQTTADEGIVSLPRIVVITRFPLILKWLRSAQLLENIGSIDAF
jgi:hypothetical protein